MNHELPDVLAGFRKGKGTRDQIANICWIIKKAREFRKNIYFCFIDYELDEDRFLFNPHHKKTLLNAKEPVNIPKEITGCKSV